MKRYSEKINIHKKGQQLKFYADTYHVDVLGGVDVVLNGFSIDLIHEDGSEIGSTTFTFPVQSLYGWTRGKRKFSIGVPKEGVYTIRFNNPSKLRVRRSNVMFFPLSLLFKKPIPNEEISVVFYRKIKKKN